MEHFGHCLWIVVSLAQMVLCGWECSEYAICQRCSRWFPALLDWVKFRRVRREILDAQGLFMSLTELVEEFSAMRWSVIDEKEDASPSSKREFEKPDEIALSFPLAERVGESSSGSFTKDVRTNILVVVQD